MLKEEQNSKMSFDFFFNSVHTFHVEDENIFNDNFAKSIGKILKLIFYNSQS